MKKMSLFFLMIILLSTLLGAGGCTRYQFRINSLPLREADLYPQEQNQKGLMVAVDDYFDEDKSYQAFGVNFLEEDILVLEVIVSNKSSDVYTVKGSEVLLIKNNQVIYPLLASEISTDKKINQYLNAIELKDMMIKPGESKHGFLYFQLPGKPLEEEKQESRFSFLWPYDYKLRVGATRVEDSSRLIYTIYLRNL